MGLYNQIFVKANQVMAAWGMAAAVAAYALPLILCPAHNSLALMQLPTDQLAP